MEQNEGDVQVKVGAGKYFYFVSVDELKELARKENISIRYTTENMQKNKDGNHSVRVSVIMSERPELLDMFSELYDGYMKRVSEEISVEHYKKGNWKDISQLIEGEE